MNSPAGILLENRVGWGGSLLLSVLRDVIAH